MAYGDLSFFLPQQQYYRNPGDYTNAMKNAALQKASYLAQIDVEMAQLDEAKRQFDKRLTYDYTSLDRQTDIAKEQNKTQRLGTYGTLAIGAGNVIAPFLQDYSARNWAEGMADKLGWFGSDAESKSAGTNFDWFGSQDFSSSSFDLDGLDTTFNTDIWNNAWNESPLLDYDFDLSW